MLHSVAFSRKLLVVIQDKLVNDVVFRGNKTMANAVSNFLHSGKDGILYLTETVLLAHFNNVEHSFGNIHQKLIHGDGHTSFLNFARHALNLETAGQCPKFNSSASLCLGGLDFR